MTSSQSHHERRWLILAVLGLAQLMVILDVTVVNIWVSARLGGEVGRVIAA